MPVVCQYVFVFGMDLELYRESAVVSPHCNLTMHFSGLSCYSSCTKTIIQCMQLKMFPRFEASWKTFLLGVELDKREECER